MSFSDVLFAFTEWLRTTPLVETALSISEHPLSLLIASHFWAIPIIQTLHILALAAAFGSVLMINLHILGLTGKSRTLTQTVKRFQPWIWWSLAVLVVTGIGMIIGEPIRELINPIFWIKMGLVIALVLLSLWYNAALSRNMVQWDMTLRARAGVRFGAIGLILLWCAIMFAGRWIAYAPV
ncbi:MAG TPA: DUF6644 family protein [Sphingobium sp.]|nr:DUF6644 family protein [Sphingobium sp.]